MAAGAAYVGRRRASKPVPVRDLSSIGVAGRGVGRSAGVDGCGASAGVSGQAELAERRTARVAAMTGIDRAADEP